MKKAQLVTLAVVLGLLASACSGSYTVPPLPAESASDPLGQADSETEPASILAAEPLNDGAAFDRFVMERFPSARPAQFGVLQVIISGHCNGLVDQDSIGALTQDGDLQAAILNVSDDECDSMETSSVLAQSTPVDATTWAEAVSRRFARTVWWYDEAAFAIKAEQACQTGASSFALGTDNSLSTSVVIELAALTTHGDCLLLSATDGQPVQTTAAADSGIAVDADAADRDVVLYFLRASTEENIADRVRDLYSLHVASGVVTRVTTGQEVKSVDLSPDGTQLTYIVEGDEAGGDGVIYVADVAGNDARVVGSTEYISSVRWTPDGSGLLHSSVDAEGNRVISELDLSTGSEDVLIVPTLRNVWPEAVAGGDLFYTDSDGNDPLLVQFDVARSEIKSSGFMPYGNMGIAPDGSQAVVSERGTGDLWWVNMEADMALSPLASGPGLEAWPAISPDNRYVAYGVGPEFRANQIFITDITSPEVRVNLTDGFETGKVGKALWAPDSQSLFFNSGEFDFESMYMVSIDGQITNLGEVGRPVLVVAN